jgi:transcription elongation GreA/GreB family factor
MEIEEQKPCTECERIFGRDELTRIEADIELCEDCLEKAKLMEL